MPELPEVETIKRELVPFVRGKVFAEVEVIDPRNIKDISAPKLKEKLKGQKIVDLSRCAKYLLFSLASGNCLVIHLGMTGRLLFAPDKYVKVIFHFKDGKALYFSDARMFGKIRFYENDPPLKLGPEPLTPEFTVGFFKKLLAKRKTAIKLLLMDQKHLSGVGNIYANEALFISGIHPSRPASSLSDKEIRKLHQAIENILKDAIHYRGTSDNWYVDAKGEKGEFQLHLKVYGRKGEPCVKCKTPITRIGMGQRGTYFCKKCQK